MPNPISTSFLTSATPVNTGANKADENPSNATDAQFSGLLNQALLQNHTHTPQQTDNTLKNNNMPVSNKAENQAQTEAEPQSTSAENAIPDESHLSQEPSGKKSDAATDTTTPNQQIDPQNLQALALSLQIQPINLNTVQGAPLFSQALPFTAQTVNPGQSNENQQSISSITTNQSTHLTQTLNSLQNPLAFSLSPTTNTQIRTGDKNTPQAPIQSELESQTPTQLPNSVAAAQLADMPTQSKLTSELENTMPGKVSIPFSNNSAQTENPIGLAASVVSNQSPLNQTALTGQTSPAATNNSIDQASLSQSSSTSSQIQTNDNGSLNPTSGSLNAIASGLQLQANPNQLNPGNPKPNASTPNSVSFLKSLNRLHTTLNALNGEVETPSKSAPSGKIESKNSDPIDENLTTGLSPGDTSDLLAAAGLNGLSNTTGNNSDNANSSITAFTSPADNPVSQVADGTAYSIKNGHKELIIRLNPDNLGEVRVNLTSHANQELSARLIASTPESHNLLKTQLDSLKSTLESQGITVDRLSVVLAGSPEASTNNHSHQQQSSQQQSSQQQQQQNMQQGSFQQQFNQQNPGSAALFNQMGNQSQNNFAQRFNNSSNSNSPDTSALDNGSTTATQAGNNDNGRISILA